MKYNKSQLRKKTYLVGLALLTVSLNAAIGSCEDYRQVAGLMDIRTTFSDGAHDLEFLVRLAKNRGFNVLFINDHDRMAMEHGLFPFRNIVKTRVEKPSVNQMGAQKYLDAIRDIDAKYPEMIVIPGVECAPFYYWTGNPPGGLTAHGWERHILVMGLTKAQDYANLPVLHNRLPTALTAGRIGAVLLFVSVAVIGFFVFRWKGAFRILGVLLVILGVAFVIDTCVSSNFPFDQYHGDQGVAPYQHLIDYVNAKGGVTFWNHPETRSGVGEKPPIHVSTPPYPEVLEESRGYTGFAALHGDKITVTEPGSEWDRVLQEYCTGERLHPPWGISAADYHREGESGEKLGKFPTVFLLKEFRRDAILSALRNGKMYAVYGRHDKRGILSEFTVSDPVTGNKGWSGDEICAAGPVAVRIAVLATDENVQKIHVRLIRDGKLIKNFDAATPFTVDFKDDYFEGGKKLYYRVDVKGEIGAITSNPIFVVF
ncbi:MAG: hypothetical protein HWN68_15110 [Desulfobacterales bacterium]|nr:hypothetical protein [Desulfobacterales bacterium]